MTGQTTAKQERRALLDLISRLFAENEQLQSAGFEVVSVFARGEDHYAALVCSDEGAGWGPADPKDAVAMALSAFGEDRMLRAGVLYGIRANAAGVALLEPQIGRLDDPLFADLTPEGA